MRTGDTLVDNLAPVLEEEVYKMPLINADETPMKVLELVESKGKAGLLLFTFSENRRNETILDLFSTYSGCVQTDGLNGYRYAARNGSFTHLGRLVHARRKALEACGDRKSGFSHIYVAWTYTILITF